MPFKFITTETKNVPNAPFFANSDGWVERLKTFQAQGKCIGLNNEFKNNGSIRVRTSTWLSEAEWLDFRNLEELREEVQAWNFHNSKFNITMSEERINS